MGSDESRFRIVPDPPVAGKTAEVFYVGPASEVEFQVDSNEPVRVKPDEEGRIKIDKMPSGDEIMFDDRLGFPGYLHREILHLS